jgi:uncharacterized protein (DUF983 family)
MQNKPNWKAAFLARCPVCGSGGAFCNVIKLAAHCKQCGTALDEYETADGPAFFAITIVGTLVGIFAALLEVFKSPPFWVHLVLWVPLTFVTSFIIIRITKTLMVAHQYKLHGRKS